MPCACIGACACLAATSALSGLLGYYFYDIFHLCTFKTPPNGALMSERGDTDCTRRERNGVNCMEKECYDSLVVDAIVIDENKSMSLYYDAKA